MNYHLRQPKPTTGATGTLRGLAGRQNCLIRCQRAPFLLLLFCVGSALSGSLRAGTYSTEFARSENPISESGHWISGAAVGLDWADISITNGVAIGHEPGFNGYDDATALLIGSWGSNQTAMATVYTTNRMSGNVYEELEMRLRSTLAPRWCTGYEVLFSLKSDSGCYVQIVRWNGALGDFTYVAATSGSQFILHTGDVIKASITNQLVTAFINGKQVLQGTDTHFASGNPGMGIFIQGVSGVNGDYGFTRFTATDGLVMPPSAVCLQGPGTNVTWTRRCTSVRGTACLIENPESLSPSAWKFLTYGVADEFGLFQVFDVPPPGASRRFYRLEWP